MRKISSRLMEIAKLIKKDERIADIGSDHGYLPIYLIKNGVINHALVSDINKRPLERARLNAGIHGVNDKLVFILCDGLDNIDPDMADTYIIAGMSGDTIAGILNRAPWTREKRLILQPVSASDSLRRFLSENRYMITGESIVKDTGKYYFTIEATGGQMDRMTAAGLHIGTILNAGNNPVFSEYIERLTMYTRRAAEGMAKSSKVCDIARLEEYTELLKGLLKAKGEYFDKGK